MTSDAVRYGLLASHCASPKAEVVTVWSTTGVLTYSAGAKPVLRHRDSRTRPLPTRRRGCSPTRGRRTSPAGTQGHRCRQVEGRQALRRLGADGGLRAWPAGRPRRAGSTTRHPRPATTSAVTPPCSRARTSPPCVGRPQLVQHRHRVPLLGRCGGAPRRRPYGRAGRRSRLLLTLAAEPACSAARPRDQVCLHRALAAPEGRGDVSHAQVEHVVQGDRLRLPARQPSHLARTTLVQAPT